jgi:hypothetical protein
MPLPIKVKGKGSGEIEIVRLEVSENGQSFNTPISFDITSIEIDPETHLISKNNNSTLGVDLIVLEKEITVYPNPVKNTLTIKNNSQTILKKLTIYDVLGRKIIQKENPSNIISMDKLNFGIHLVVIKTDKGTIHKTILKK